MKVCVSEYQSCANIELIPENVQEISLLTRLALNTKPDKVEFATFFNHHTIESHIYFDFVKDKKSSVRNTSRRK